jgi:hypothetical protein
MLTLIADRGLTDRPELGTRKVSGTTRKWLDQFLKKNAARKAPRINCDAIEKKQKVKLPDDYKNFVSTVGEKAFKNVNGLEETLTTVLPPEDLDFKGFRRGKVRNLEGDGAKVDGVMFASTDFGDYYVFDVSNRGIDYPVFWYRHEENTMEFYAPNFAECIKRFVLKS